MNRQIIFRVWDNVDYMSTYFCLQDVQSAKIQFTKDCKIMQFTGLHDKNHKPIYEGDIFLISRMTARKYVVEYSEGGENNHEWHGACFVIRADEETVFPFDANALEFGEVIGNIYQHPELLK